MIFRKTKIDGLCLIEPELKIDERGWFARFFCGDELAGAGINFNVAQISRSLTAKKGTIRGMHFQKEPKAEDKIIQCLRGAVFDVVVDLRKHSPTYGKWVAEELSGSNKMMIYVGKGFAHGFQTLTDNCEMQYFVSEFYSPEHSSGVRWDDPFFGISWPIDNSLLSEKDRKWPFINNL